jgi:BMFP domain-containing protein YqiC
VLGGQRVAVDGSHFNGNVSDKSFRSVAGLRQDIAKLDKKIDQWLEGLDVADRETLEAPAPVAAQRENVKALQVLKAVKEAELTALEAAGKTQHSVTDPDARLLNKRGHTTAGYNVQIVVDARHKLIVADEVTQAANDLGRLHPMLAQAKATLGVECLEGLVP